MIIYTYNSFSAEQIEKLKTTILSANYGFVLISGILAFSGYVLRAYRWKYALEHVGYKANFKLNLAAVSIGYFLNLTIPRSGEILRATTLSSYEKIPFEINIPIFHHSIIPWMGQKHRDQLGAGHQYLATASLYRVAVGLPDRGHAGGELGPALLEGEHVWRRRRRAHGRAHGALAHGRPLERPLQRAHHLSQAEGADDAGDVGGL